MIIEIQAKTLLSGHKQPDPWFQIKYGMNIYRGCEHQCIYCDSRSLCYGIADFRDVLVKVNAIERLRDELPRKRLVGIVGTGAMSDPYTFAERQYGLTGQALQVLADEGFPVHVTTKSDLVVKDLDTLAQIAQTRAIVSFTLTTVDDELAARVEPLAPSPSRRLAAMAKLASAGVEVGALLMPILPFIEDDPASIRAIVQRAADAGATYALAAMGTTMREGSRDWFYTQLDASFAGLRQRYERTYGLRYECACPRAAELWDAFHEERLRHGIADRLAPYEPHPRRPPTSAAQQLKML
ncbi:MAG: radical SAM protein [Chloroflexi bacterium]|jgi:DNA repair photolyase|nr:radical SAM protein [Chloroflexota bacterium]